MAEEFVNSYSEVQQRFVRLTEFANRRTPGYFEKYPGKLALELSGIAALPPAKLIRRDNAEALILAFGGAIAVYSRQPLVETVTAPPIEAAQQLARFSAMVNVPTVEDEFPC